MKWRTEISVPRLDTEINHATSVVMIGSCFTDEIGHRLQNQLFDVSVNPSGILFNPESIADTIADALDEKRFTADELFEVDGTWRTLRRHSRFSLPDRDATLELLNSSIDTTRSRLLSADLLIVTLGSAIVHRHIPSGKVAANCHKQPSQLFSVEKLRADDIVARWQSLLSTLLKLNPGLKVVFTVSPVRHIGYGLQRDRLSKSTLIVAVNELLGERVNYFPSYEIIVDDLRDYRWYAEDMVHPSSQAVDYVYDIFRSATMTPQTIATAEKWGKLTRRMAHRHTSPQAELRFRDETAAMAKELATGDNALFQRFISLTQ
ncbi:MAG: GSCFA domain-containing protein [Muribaculaceae bacterium]|nr:GSCFA domain-containing protein [Muribaculaceae bacterium]